MNANFSRVCRLAALLAAGFSPAAGLLAETRVVINEFKSDTPGPDTGEFLELFAYDVTTGEAVPGFPLTGYVVVFFNGAAAGNPAYAVTPVGGRATTFLDLGGRSTNASGFFVIGSPGVPGAELPLAPGANGWFQNGADGVGLYKDPTTVFTASTGATAAELVDAIVYGTDDPGDPDLLEILTPGAGQLNEAPNSVHALARIPDGGGPFASEVFIQQAPSPGTFNQPVAMLELAVARAVLSEGEAGEGTLARGGSTAAAVTVTFASSDPGEARAPATVEIPAGAASVPVVFTGVDDLWPDGAQTAELTATAPGYGPGRVTLTVTDNGDSDQPVVINEVFATGSGDANLDGASTTNEDRFNDEFVEIVNRGAEELDLSGHQLFTASLAAARHTFPAGTVLPAGAAVVVFGGGRPAHGITEAFGTAWIQTANAPTHGLHLLEPSARLSLLNTAGREVAGFDYDDQVASPDSLTRSPELTGSPVPHGTRGDGSILFSPGTRADGAPFAGLTARLAASVAPATIVEGAGAGAATLSVRREAPFTHPLVVTVRSDDPAEAAPAAGVLHIPAGEAGGSLPLNIPDDTALDGPQTVAFTCIAAGHLNGAASLEVTDDGRDTPPLGVFINEIDSDQPGSDTKEFIELYVGEAAAKALDGYTVVLFNGNQSANGAYAVFDLAGRSSNARGFFVLGNATVPNVDLVIADASIQNGTDAVAVYHTAAAAFSLTGSPTPPSHDALIDVVVYGNGSAGDPDLLAGFQSAGDPPVPELSPQHEGEANNGTSLARLPDASSAFGPFTAQTPTPGATNAPGAAAEPRIEITLADGALVVTYTGTLEQSSTLHPGSFAPVAGAASPHSIPLPPGGSLYFRAAAP